MDELSSYWISMEPLYFTLRLFGLMPYKVMHDKGDSPLALCVVSGLWSVVSVFGQLSAVWFALTEMPADFGDRELERLLRMLTLTFVCLFPLFWWNANSLLHYVNSWHIYEMRFEYVTGGRLRNTVRPSFTYWCLVFSVASVLCLLTADQLLHASVWHHCFVLAYLFASMHSCLITILWITNCLFIQQVSKKIREFLIQIVDTTESTELVDGARVLWLSLRGQSALLCASTGPALCASLAAHGACAMLGACALTRGAAAHLAPTVAWGAAALALCCHCAHALRTEMGINLLRDILLLRLLSIKIETRNEIELFFSNVLHYPVDLTLCGVIHLSRRFLFLVITSTTLILLLRLPLVLEIPK